MSAPAQVYKPVDLGLTKSEQEALWLGGDFLSQSYPDGPLGQWYREMDRVGIVAKLRGHTAAEIVEGLESVRICDYSGLQAAAAPLLIRKPETPEPASPGPPLKCDCGASSEYECVCEGVD